MNGTLTNFFSCRAIAIRSDPAELFIPVEFSILILVIEIFKAHRFLNLPLRGLFLLLNTDKQTYMFLIMIYHTPGKYLDVNTSHKSVEQNNLMVKHMIVQNISVKKGCTIDT